jgi:hypothetical protein
MPVGREDRLDSLGSESNNAHGIRPGPPCCIPRVRPSPQ